MTLGDNFFNKQGLTMSYIPCLLTADSQSEGHLQMNTAEFSNDTR